MQVRICLHPAPHLCVRTVLVGGGVFCESLNRPAFRPQCPVKSGSHPSGSTEPHTASRLLFTPSAAGSQP